ncbi:hypothetical protein PCANC_27527 [Puccinia coronata f. sp. avenae]|uniref:Uncharacterized protein n=1 Tax=Puccinia coronata f. sp. avenae TaxID=200324 RepID=A0A2N5TT93_9BASI|nr:hypothetical protein PCANC_27527 [Puccinia coronata f. sp. avenae]
MFNSSTQDPNNPTAAYQSTTARTSSTPTNSSILATSNQQSTNAPALPANNANSTHPAPAPIPATSAPVPVPATPAPHIPEPDPAATSTCRRGSTGTSVTFTDRDCSNAAKVLSGGGATAAQCGNCVLGLYDADKKELFKPPGPIPLETLEEQALKLLKQCKNSNSPKMLKRDAPSNSSSTDTVNIELLMGYNEKPKSC